MNEHVNQRFLSEAPVNLPANKRDPEYWSDAMVELLSRLDIDYVFLLPGSSYRGLHDSLVNYGRNHKPKMVLTTHEQIAVSMAHGYAKATGRLGVCILHDLVGLMNGSMGVYNAFGDHAPVLILGGSGPLDPADRRWIDWLHCASTQADIVKNYVKWTEEPTTPQWHLDAIAKAHKVALTAPRGPVYVTLDCGIQEQKIEGPVTMPDPKFFQPAPPVAANPDALAAAADALLDAKLPLIVGGRFGINPAVTKPLVELVELTGAVYRDDNGIIAFPTAHPQNVSRRPRDREGSRRRDGDRLPRSREPARQLHRAQGERRLRARCAQAARSSTCRSTTCRRARGPICAGRRRWSTCRSTAIRCSACSSSTR